MQTRHGRFYRFARTQLMRWFDRKGWRIEASAQHLPDKLVLCAAPHSSNWDLPFALATAFHYDVPISWVGKSSLFRWPFGGLMRNLGGVAVDRSKRADTVQTLANAIKQAPGRFYLVIAPEGTRSQVKEWKSGFYHIALAANVPIALAFLDYQRKIGSITQLFHPTGDYDADIATIRDFYKGITPKQVK
jgi:1-acyl-sn-glycerol-3-phosphate acyltransferase